MENIEPIGVNGDEDLDLEATGANLEKGRFDCLRDIRGEIEKRGDLIEGRGEGRNK